ncbi:probable aminotransferase ACS12 [Andrographis paniculata]|uniref:probable aminotransferase ACS12 n=1 Tax=Andrographis paniculata TaxID=175694 RepID=UPI0021E89293|nr:probable aminotransferase ACS12 [Andrographis paniculata]
MKKNKTSSSSGGGGGGGGAEAAAAMRVIVPLQGVVQGRGGLVLGSVIPCALLYFIQLYFRSRGGGGGDGREKSPPAAEAEQSSPALQRVHSRTLLFSRGHAPPPHVSSRAAAIAQNCNGPYYAGLERAHDDPYDDVANPDGVIHLALSHNTLVSDLVGEWVADHCAESLFGQELNMSDVAAYQPFDGLMELKMATSRFMSWHTGKGRFFDPENIVLTSGAAPAVEMLVFSLADTGNAFLVPSPYCPDLDEVKWRTGVEFIPVPCRRTDAFAISINALDRAFNQAKNRRQKVRGIIISNPSNPAGVLHSREVLETLLDFATEKNIHIISIESVLASEEFVSMTEVAEDVDKTRVHIVHALSNDLSVPSLATEFIYTCNETVLASVKKLARFSSVSVPTQRVLTSMLSDTKFVGNAVKVTRERIRRMRAGLAHGLRKSGIECVGSDGGLYCWADMSPLIRSYSEKGEIEMFDRLLSVAKINAVPGCSCHSVELGWFGFCFASLREEDIDIVLRRIRTVSDAGRSPR